MASRTPILAAIVFLTLAPGIAHGDTATVKAREHYEKGTRAYSLGRFDEAIKEYSDAYELRDDPSLLFNIAQAHRLNHSLERALFFYRSYLSRSPNAPNAVDVRQKIADLQRQMEEQKNPQNAVPPSTVTPHEDAAGTTGKAPEPPRVPAAPAPIPTRDGRSRQSITGIGLVAGGAALVVAGVVLSALVPGLNHDLHQAADRSEVYDPSIQSRAKAFQVAGPILYGAGAAAAATGVVLLCLAPRERPGKRAFLTPMVHPSFTGLSFSGVF